MRILWFTNTPSNYIGNLAYNGGGWISSLETEMKNAEDMSLAVSFLFDGQPFKVSREGVAYYPISCKETSGYRIHLHSLFNTLDKIDSKIVDKCLKVIDDFNPDIIHVFGSEGPFGLIAKHTTKPIILHIQGILQPIFNAFLPPMMSWNDYYLSDFNPLHYIKRVSQIKRWKHNCIREREILQHISLYCGRTEWDNTLSGQMSPGRHYFHVGEILRDSFYHPASHHFPSKLTLVSTISDIPFKGMDVILKTAKILCEQYKADFDWLVYGISDAKPFERLTNIRCKDVGVKLCGVVDEATLCESLLNATAFLSLSYIDNSPNSLCEAQILGCPVIATYVGGKPSLISHKDNGFLVPANSPYVTAQLIMQLYGSKSLSSAISIAGKETATERHDKNKILKQLLETYHYVASNGVHSLS